MAAAKWKLDRSKIKTGLKLTKIYKQYSIDGNRGQIIFDWDRRISPCAKFKISLENVIDAVERGFNLRDLSTNTYITQLNLLNFINSHK